VKVVDRKPAPGEVQCGHIMIRFDKQDPTPEDTLAAYEKIKALQDSLNAGIDFAGLAMRNSGDPSSAQRGGDLGWFTRRRWIQSFDEVAVAMKKGQISPIVRTIYGYHIIQCTDTRPPKTFDEAKKEVQQLYQQVRFQEDYNTFIGKLKKEVSFSLNQDAVARFLAALDSTKTTKDSAWAAAIPADVGAATMFTFGTRPVSVDSVVGLISGRQDLANVPLRASGMKPTLDKIAEQLVFNVKAETMERDHPEFRAIMGEYVDGILLYQIEQDRVWNRVTVSDSALRAYFDTHSDNFMYPDRVDYSVLRMANDSLARVIERHLGEGKTFEEIVASDSARMRTPSTFQALFGNGSARITPQTQKVLRTVAGDLTGDPNLRVQLVAHPDTTRNKAQNLKLAAKRLETIKAELIKKYGIAESRVSSIPRPVSKPGPVSDKERGSMGVLVDIAVTGRRAIIVGGLQTEILPVTTDELSMAADSLTPGSTSRPFQYQSAYVIVRLNRKDPLRHKSFEEAGTEVSSAFQEYESKRLEKEWLDGLRKQYPVVEYKEVLKDAFAPPQ
jgi:parvulin-like peptidyl-prolyl isomerase/outer membrane protein OmpA-like peptidoglycan-associated protein